MGGSPSRPAPAIEEIHRHHDAERRMAELEAQITQLSAKEQSTENEARRLEGLLRDETKRNEELTESLYHNVHPTRWPKEEEFESMKHKYHYSPDKFYVAIAGQSGTGKSSLVNALRGIYPEDEGAAATGDAECTMDVTSYPDPDLKKNLTWFDVPGAGTLSHPEAEYFIDKGLYIFDAILVVFGDRFGSTDIAILRQCGLWGIPTYIVRSKADIFLRNRHDTAVKAEIRKRKQEKKSHRLSDDEKDQLLKAAKDGFVDETRKSVEKELMAAGLHIQTVFIISREGLLSRVRGKASEIAKAVMDKENEGVRIDCEDGKDCAGVEGEDVGEDEDEDEPYVVFDEDKLLKDLICSSLHTRVPKDSGWFGSALNFLSKRLPTSAINMTKGRVENEDSVQEARTEGV